MSATVTNIASHPKFKAEGLGSQLFKAVRGIIEPAAKLDESKASGGEMTDALIAGMHKEVPGILKQVIGAVDKPLSAAKIFAEQPALLKTAIEAVRPLIKPFFDRVTEFHHSEQKFSDALSNIAKTNPLSILSNLVAANHTNAPTKDSVINQ